jgi:methyl-accepting chemotaxis protein
VTPPFLVRDAAIARAIGRAAALRDAAAFGLRLAVGLLLAVCGVIGAATWLFVRRVVRALTALTASIAALAGRDHAVAVPFQARRDEVGRMAGAIEVLRRNAIAFYALTEQASEQQRLRAARAERWRRCARRSAGTRARRSRP